MAICENKVAGWKTVLGLFLQTSFYLGTIKSIGIYFSELEASLGTTGTDVGLILGLYSGFFFAPAPFVTYLYRFSYCRRYLLVTGAVLSSLGLILGALVSANSQLALCLSFAGFGGCILSVCCVITLEKESGQNFQFIYGIGKSGYSFGMVLVPLLAEYLMDIYGWRGSMMIIGAMAGNIIPLTIVIDVKKSGWNNPNTANAKTVCLSDDEKTKEPIGTCIRPSDDTDKPTPNMQSTRPFKGLFSSIHQQAKDITSQVDPWISVFIIASAFGGMVGGGWHAFLVPRTVSSGIPLSTAIHLLYPASVACFLGRILSGSLHQSKCLSTLDMYLLMKVLNASSLLVDILVPIYPLKFATTFLNAFCIAEANMLIVFICKERSLPSFFPFAYALVTVSYGAGNLIGTYLTGLIADLTGNYNASFMLLVAFDAVIICLTIPSRYFPSKCREFHKGVK